MFILCKNKAFSRTDTRAEKKISVKVTDAEYEKIEEMLVYYGEDYISNLLRMGLNEMYFKMMSKKK